jgi:hypothetical protein
MTQAGWTGRVTRGHLGFNQSVIGPPCRVPVAANRCFPISRMSFHTVCLICGFVKIVGR